MSLDGTNASTFRFRDWLAEREVRLKLGLHLVIFPPPLTSPSHRLHKGLGKWLASKSVYSVLDNTSQPGLGSY